MPPKKKSAPKRKPANGGFLPLLFLPQLLGMAGLGSQGSGLVGGNVGGNVGGGLVGGRRRKR